MLPLHQRLTLPRLEVRVTAVRESNSFHLHKWQSRLLCIALRIFSLHHSLPPPHPKPNISQSPISNICLMLSNKLPCGNLISKGSLLVVESSLYLVLTLTPSWPSSSKVGRNNQKKFHSDYQVIVCCPLHHRLTLPRLEVRVATGRDSNSYHLRKRQFEVAVRSLKNLLQNFLSFSLSIHHIKSTNLLNL